MASLETPNIMMIGPTQAGKTTLLSVLRLAAMRRLSDGSSISVEPINPEAKALFREALEITRTGNFDKAGTIEVREYKFNLTCQIEKDILVDNYVDEQKPGIVSFLTGETVRVNRPITKRVQAESVMSLTVLDGRGGHIFGEPDGMEDKNQREVQRKRLVELATSSAALIVCVNALDPKTTEAFFREFQAFLDDVKQSGGRVPFERVAIVVTHADRLVEDFGSSAQSELKKRDAAEEASKAMGFFAKSGLFQTLEPAARERVYAGWASVYGFIHMEGSVNFDSGSNRIAIFRENDAKWTDEWYPLGIPEPFVFACTGKCLNMVKISKP